MPIVKYEHFQILSGARDSLNMLVPVKFVIYRVHTTSSLQKVITFYDYFSLKNYDFFMTGAIFLCRGLMFSDDVTH